MFTGIIETIAKIIMLRQYNGDARLHMELTALPEQQIKIGDSIAINGTCLTVVEIKQKILVFDISAETLCCTNLGELKAEQWVNIEFAMLPTTRFGGHIVSGHIDGLAQISSIRASGECWEIKVNIPTALQKYIVNKGSVSLDGVSLTVNRVEGNECSINIIPHTWQHTISQFYKIGSRVNVEVDLIARYLERLLNERSL